MIDLVTLLAADHVTGVEIAGKNDLCLFAEVEGECGSLRVRVPELFLGQVAHDALDLFYAPCFLDLLFVVFFFLLFATFREFFFIFYLLHSIVGLFYNCRQE